MIPFGDRAPRKDDAGCFRGQMTESSTPVLDPPRVAGANAVMMVYKILRPLEWSHLHSNRLMHGSPVDLADGFVHLSTGGQLGETLRRHFRDEGDLILLACDSAALGHALRWEPSRGGELFPHLYRALTLEDVLWSRQVAKTPWGHDTGTLQ